jgi:hypothetical protein
MSNSDAITIDSACVNAPIIKAYQIKRPAAGTDSRVTMRKFLVDLKAAYAKNVGTILATGPCRRPIQTSRNRHLSV